MFHTLYFFTLYISYSVLYTLRTFETLQVPGNAATIRLSSFEKGTNRRNNTEIRTVMKCRTIVWRDGHYATLHVEIVHVAKSFSPDNSLHSIHWHSIWKHLRRKPINPPENCATCSLSPLPPPLFEQLATNFSSEEFGSHPETLRIGHTCKLAMLVLVLVNAGAVHISQPVAKWPELY